LASRSRTSPGSFNGIRGAKNALQTTIEGAEIGLAGARDIVVQHAGSISVSSKEGQGSSFTVKLPLT